MQDIYIRNENGDELVIHPQAFLPAPAPDLRKVLNQAYKAGCEEETCRLLLEALEEMEDVCRAGAAAAHNEHDRLTGAEATYLAKAEAAKADRDRMAAVLKAAGLRNASAEEKEALAALHEQYAQHKKMAADLHREAATYAGKEQGLLRMIEKLKKNAAEVEVWKTQPRRS